MEHILQTSGLLYSQSLGYQDRTPRGPVQGTAAAGMRYPKDRPIQDALLHPKADVCDKSPLSKAECWGQVFPVYLPVSGAVVGPSSQELFSCMGFGASADSCAAANSVSFPFPRNKNKRTHFKNFKPMFPPLKASCSSPKLYP